jgi:hypothetical protein
MREEKGMRSALMLQAVGNRSPLGIPGFLAGINPSQEEVRSPHNVAKFLEAISEEGCFAIAFDVHGDEKIKEILEGII